MGKKGWNVFLHNQIEDLPNFYDAIGDQFGKAHKAALAVSYVQRSGVAALKKCMAEIGGNIRLICSFDMEVTDPLAIKQLMDIGVIVKIYHAQRGTLHAKLWLFKGIEGCWNCIVGSANLSAHALYDNVEAGVLIEGKDNREAVGEALKVFDFIWNGDNCRELTNEDIETWIQERDKRGKIKLRSPRPLSPDEGIVVLEDFVKGWIDVGVDAPAGGEKTGIRGRLWRGWYIIPDHGYIDDGLMVRLHGICKIISSKEAIMDISSDSKDGRFGRILEIVEEKLIRHKHKMASRQLFVRQEKNYLIRFGFAVHPEKSNGKPDRNMLRLTEHGKRFSLAAKINGRKKIYTEAMQEYLYNGLPLLHFTYELLKRTRSVSFTEFSFFASHAYSLDELDSIAGLVDIYRSLPTDTRKRFERDVDAYFHEKLEPTAAGVRGNYDKKVKHTMSALGWCEGLQFDSAKKELRLAADFF